MAQIAVDVVLLPAEEIADLAIRANSELLRQYPNKIILDKKNCLPHISLAMGCIDEKMTADIGRILKEIAEKYPVEPLHITDVHINTNTKGEKISDLQIKKTESFQLLHEQVMEKLSVFFDYNVTSDMILCDGTACQSSLLWIRNYPQQSSYEKFSPHITLGYGEIKLESVPGSFSASKLALCHLGNHCTCRKVLATAELTV